MSDPELKSISVKLVNDVLEELYELRGERNWWKDEPRCNYQRDYKRLCDEISALESIVGSLGDGLAARKPPMI